MSKQLDQNIELLAPAGNIPSFKAAILAGADAIYLSGKRFGARAFAANFDEKSLRWARRVTKSLGKKMYVTLNTLVFEDEWRLLENTLDFYETIQPDALIIQDMGVAVELKKRQSRIPLHLSTQGAWWGVGGEDELKNLGFTRIILPREMSIDEIKSLTKRTSLELEAFVHGAMCYSISGRCFWSASLGHRSGNRGTCAQPCRKDYSFCNQNQKAELLFSPRDLRLADNLGEVCNSGVVSLKIEGRMKSPEYIYQTVKYYKSILNKKVEVKESVLDEVYSRVSGKGFAKGIPSKDQWKTGNSANREGVLIGKTTGRVQGGLIEIELQTQLNQGDGVFWVVNNHRHGSRITYVKAEKKRPNFSWVRGIPVNTRKNTEIRRSNTDLDKNWEREWKQEWERMPVKLFWSGHEGTALAVETLINGHAIRLTTEEKLTYANNDGLENGPLKEKFSNIGESFKSDKHVFKALDSGLFMSAKSLKKLKRSLVEVLVKFENYPPPKSFDNKRPGILKYIQADDIGKEEAVFKEGDVKNIYIRVWNSNVSINRDITDVKWVLPFEKENFHLRDVSFWLPPIFNYEQFDEIVQQIHKVDCNEYLCFGWEIFELKRIFPEKQFRCDWSFNIANLSAIEWLSKNELNCTFSREWKTDRIAGSVSAVNASMSWNPMVSMSRFPQAIPQSSIIKNSHNDKFFMLPLKNGMNGLFLVEKMGMPSVSLSGDVQLDLAVSPKENLTQIIKELAQVVAFIKS